MTNGFDILSKMDPMARRAAASLEAMQKAIAFNNEGDIEKHLNEIRSALDVLERDLELHKSMEKAFGRITTDSTHLGVLKQFTNSDSDYTGGEGGAALGVVRAGRTANVFRPHEVF